MLSKYCSMENMQILSITKSRVRTYLALIMVCSTLMAISEIKVEAWTCENTCGGVAVSYPFGSSWNCGSPTFQSYVNCSNGKLLFYSPTGTYQVQAIDYTNNIMVVMDPSMSTCSASKSSNSFGLPVGSPFSFAPYTTVGLIGCSSISSLYSKQTCDASSSSSYQFCQSFYSNCGNAFPNSYLGISASSPSTSCCVMSNSVLNTAPYEIDLPLLQCISYTSTYHMGSVQDPSGTWLFGIALQYNPGSSSSGSSGGQNPSCYICQEAEGSSSSINIVSISLVMMIAGFALNLLW